MFAGFARGSIGLCSLSRVSAGGTLVLNPNPVLLSFSHQVIPTKQSVVTALWLRYDLSETTERLACVPGERFIFDTK